ncbi:MAG: hypothetical protein KatS3mg087_1499 [Patescibacteria group bacterium]|nr:MAG: hypothetical protein KatS3mg087_1499 [Patescibacteria group bacterium]
MSITSDNQVNTFIGYGAGAANNYVGGGGNNTFIGYLAGSSNTTGNYNTVLGSNALTRNTVGSLNTAIGEGTLYYNITGYDNVAIGYRALLYNSNGFTNVAIGSEAYYSNISGNASVAIGYRTLYNNTFGYNNIAIGVYSLGSNTNGMGNTAIGSESGYGNQTGSYNTYIGNKAGYGTARSASNYNIAIGSEAGYSLSNNSSSNIFIGYRAGYNETGSNKLYIDNNSAPAGSAFIYGDMSTDQLTFNANVGIGLTSPAAWIDISGSTTSKASLRIRSGSQPSSPATGDIYNSGTTLYYYNGSSWVDLGTTGTGSIAGSGATNQIAFFTGSTAISGSNNLWWDNANSRLGIGFTNPVVSLDVASTVWLRGANANNQGLFVNSSGNVGIATTDPTARLDVSGTTWLRGLSANSGLYVNESGNIGIGTTAPGTSRLVVAGDTNTTQVVIRANSTQSNTNPLIQLQSSSGTPLMSITSDNQTNTFIGYLAGAANTYVAPATGAHNTFIGYLAGSSNTTGNYNTALGSTALISNTTGSQNVALGYFALRLSTTGNSNVAVGFQALENNTTGGDNIAIGVQALDANTTASGNTAIGRRALFSTNTGQANTAIGWQALTNNVIGQYNTAVGYYAGRYNQTGIENIFIGMNAGAGSAGRSASNYNVVIGNEAGFSLSNNSSSNIFIGYRAGYNETGSKKLYIDNGSAPAGSAFIYGDMSTDVLTFNATVGIGTTSPTNTLDVDGSARFRSVGTSSSGNVPLYITDTGVLSTSASDKRLKTNINTIDNALDKVLQLRGVTFNWTGDGTRGTGMIAQEVIDVMPELVFQNPVDGYYGLRYGETSGLLIEATKELNKKLVDLKLNFDTFATTASSSLSTSSIEIDNSLSRLDNLETNISTLETDVNNLKSEVLSIKELLSQSTHQSTESSSSIMAETPEGMLAEMYKIFEEFKAFISTLGLSNNEGTLAVSNNLNVMGDTTLYNLTVTGDITAGLMKIDTLNNIFEIAGPSCYNELTGTTNETLCADQTLYLQKSLTGRVDILNGALVVNPDGNVTVNGTLTAEKVETTDVTTENVTILAASKTIGSGVIPAGETEIVVPNELVAAGSKIFITATSSTGGQAIIVKEKVGGEKFVVAIDRPTPNDITFDWWIINTE